MQPNRPSQQQTPNNEDGAHRQGQRTASSSLSPQIKPKNYAPFQSEILPPSHQIETTTIGGFGWAQHYL